MFVGFVSQPDLITLYRKAVALVFPSFFGPENFPPLEAFALGCPVIASDVAGAREQMGDAALLVDPTKPELWSRAVVRLRRDRRLRRSLIAKGKKRALKFTREDFAKELLHLFDEFACYRRTWSSSEDKIKFVAL
jgi:glycosyltransferase involved in cell wall biosynthesis